MDTKLSVALVTRNRPDSLRRSLQSWRAQTIAPYEIVVSDDSDDDYANSVAEVAREYECVYTRGPRRGLYANRNHASLSCRGTHILSADDDHTHPADYVAVATELVETDPMRVWVFTERDPMNPEAPLMCPPELHASGFGQAPADPSHCAAVADGSTVYPRAIFDAGLRYDESYAFGGLWYLWGKLIACRGWWITFSDRTFVWHHFRPDEIVRDDGRLKDRARLLEQLLAATYVQFVDALWLERSPLRVCRSAAYVLRRLLIPDSIISYQISTRLPPAGAGQAVWRALRARPLYAR
jgi:glycosyltransferase involved in cell wall biosynthesis